jgi:ATP-dependent DNA helicase RecG
VAPHVTPEVTRLLEAFNGDMSRQELQDMLGLKDYKHFRKAYLHPALNQNLIEMTFPDTPRSTRQRYRLTAAGRALLGGRRS